MIKPRCLYVLLAVAGCGGTAESAADEQVESAGEALSPPSCTSGSFGTLQTSPQPIGANIVWTASETCAGPPPEYEFRVRIKGGTFVVTRAYSTAGTWTWNTSGAVPGEYTVEAKMHVPGTLGSTTASVEQYILSCVGSGC